MSTLTCRVLAAAKLPVISWTQLPPSRYTRFSWPAARDASAVSNIPMLATLKTCFNEMLLFYVRLVAPASRRLSRGHLTLADGGETPHDSRRDGGATPNPFLALAPSWHALASGWRRSDPSGRAWSRRIARRCPPSLARPDAAPACALRCWRR